MIFSRKKIHPRCKADLNQIYVTADGYVLPCCWVGNMPILKEYMNFHKKHLDKISCHKRSLAEVIRSKEFLTVEKSWNSRRPFVGCVKHCSEPFDSNQKTFGKNKAVTIAKENFFTKDPNLKRDGAELGES